MDKAAFDLLVHLTNVVLNEIIRRRITTSQPKQKRFLLGTIKCLDDLLDKARHEQKGGT